MSRNKYPEKTQQLIIEVATKLFLEKGYENTSLNDIISNLGGLTKGAVYHHFKSKEEIYEAVMYQRSASSDSSIEALIALKELTGIQKVKVLLEASLDSAIANHENIGAIDYEKNPRMLYAMCIELKNEVAPLFIQPILEQGIADGSIKCNQPKELADFLAFFINMWLNPGVFEMSEEEIRNKCKLMDQMMACFNLQVLDEKLISKIIKLSKCKKGK